MLKITYIEEEIFLEHLQQPVEAWKANRILVNLRAAVSVYVESSVATLVLPIDSCLKDLVWLAEKELIEIILCDEEYVEVSLLGTWIAENKNSEQGIFVCQLSSDSEHCLHQLWQKAQIETSVISE